MIEWVLEGRMVYITRLLTNEHAIHEHEILNSSLIHHLDVPAGVVTHYRPLISDGPLPLADKDKLDVFY